MDIVNYLEIKNELMILRNFGDSFANHRAFTKKKKLSFPVNKQQSNQKVDEELMRLSLSNRLTSYKGVLRYLRNNQSTVDTIDQFKESTNDLESIISRIEEMEVERQSAASGKTDVKYSAEDELETAALNTASSLYVYARKSKNIELQKTAKLSRTKLDRFKDLDLINACTIVYDAAKEVETELAKYGTTPDEVAELKVKIDVFGESISERNSSVAERVSAGATVLELFNEASEILDEELDRMADKFIDKNNQFYKGYYAARTIHDIGSRHNGDSEEETAPQTNPQQTTAG